MNPCRRTSGSPACAGSSGWGAKFVTPDGIFGQSAPLATGDYMIDVWTGGNGEKGVPNSSVTAIAQTPEGYLWVGTYNGLARSMVFASSILIQTTPPS